MRTPVALRRIARAFLAAARRARHRLQTHEDPKALHDFRVALRRLRSTLRIYRPVVGTKLVPRKWRRQLKRLARETSEARDAEVGLAWFRAQFQQTSGIERAACERLIEIWSSRCDRAYAKVRRVLDREFAALDAGLRQALSTPPPPGTTPMLASTAGALMHDQVAELHTELHCINSIADAKTIHAARIEAKRLRYLLEPLAGEVANGKTLLKTLKSFQDDFGKLCDCQVLSEEIISTVATHTADQSGERMRALFEDRVIASIDDATPEGFRALAVRLQTERKQQYARIAERYLGERIDALLAPYRTLADSLAHRRPSRTRNPRARRSKPPRRRAR